MKTNSNYSSKQDQEPYDCFQTVHAGLWTWVWGERIWQFCHYWRFTSVPNW